MTDEAKTPEPESESAQQRSDWANEAEAALEGVGNALREAWAASRDARLGALESAKKAAQQLGEAIDHGVAAAKERWEAQEESTAASDDPDAQATEAQPHHHVPQMSPDEGRADKQ